MHISNLRYMAASKHGCIHTHLCNAVPLVWGLLRLAPTNVCNVRVGYISIIRSAFESSCHQDLVWPQRGFRNSLCMCLVLVNV